MAYAFITIDNEMSQLQLELIGDVKFVGLLLLIEL